MKRRVYIIFFIFSFFVLGNINKVCAQENDFIFPVKDPKVSIEFGESWYAGEQTGWLRGHLGEDFLGPVGTDVFAVNNAIVASVGKWDKETYTEKKCILINNEEKCTWINHKTHGWGPTIALEHSLENGFYNLENTTLDPVLLNKPINKVYSLYGHLDNVDKFNVGDKILRGEKISEIGDISNWTTKHLHFEIKNQDAFNTDILNGVGAGYSKVDNYTPNHYSPSIFLKNNGEKNFSFQESLEKIPSSNFQIEFLNNKETLIVQKNSELEIKIKIKNLGSDIKAGDLSFNVVNGVEKNKIFKHQTWLTALRPALFNQNLKSGEETEISFFINTPSENGDYEFECLLVKNNTWEKISSVENFKISLRVGDAVFSFLENENLEEQKSLENEKTDENFIEKIKNDIIQKTDQIIEKIKNIFNCDSTASLDEIIENPSEEPEELNLEKNFSVIFPETLSYTTNTNHLFLSGTKTANLEKIYINSSSQEISFTSTTWQKEIFLNSGENNFIISADEVTSSINLSINFQKNLKLPVISFRQNESNFEHKTETEIIWSGEDADFYDLEFKKNDGEWLKIFTMTTNTIFATTTEIGDEIFARIRSGDTQNNFTDWVEANFVVDFSRKVVINEIAWMGVNSSRSNYEWLELYNNTNEDIDLDGWKLVVGNFSGVSSTIYLNGVIKNNDFLLLARNSKVFLNISNYLLFNFAIHNTGAKIILYDNLNQIIDETDQKQAWFGGEVGEKYRTLERINPNISGNLQNNWQSNEIFHYNSESTGNVPIFGSPNQPNNNYFYLPESYEYYYPNFWDENNTFVLKKEHSPYLFYNLNIPINHKIVVEPGVIIYGVHSDAKIKVLGEFELNGSEEERISITSRFDSISGGKYLNFNSNPQTRDWKNIEILTGGKMSAKYTDFKYGGKKDYIGSQSYENIIKNCGGEVTFDNIKISDSFISSASKDALIYNSGKIKIENSSFFGSTKFLFNENQGEVVAEKNIFSGFADDYLLYFTDRLPVKFENNYFENSIKTIGVNLATINEDLNFDSEDNYVFRVLNIGASSTVNLTAGTEMKFLPGGKLNVYGKLFAYGEQNKQISISGSGSFSGIFVAGGELFGEYLNIKNSGYFSNINDYFVAGVDETYGLWLINEAKVNLINSSFLDTRRPGAIIYSQNSSLSLKNSYLGWVNNYEKLSSWYDNGINLFNSNLYLENTVFQKMDLVIDNNLSTTTYQNMSRENFQDLFCQQNRLVWTPLNLFDFNPCSTEKTAIVNNNLFLINKEELDLNESASLEDAEQKEMLESNEDKIGNELQENKNCETDALFLEVKNSIEDIEKDEIVIQSELFLDNEQKNFTSSENENLETNILFLENNILKTDEENNLSVQPELILEDKQKETIDENPVFLLKNI
ncbi:MAG: peptidoglycan DD-metalloendopeptidase family protein [Patescibacteria group bacterium]